MSAESVNRPCRTDQGHPMTLHQYLDVPGIGTVSWDALMPTSDEGDSRGAGGRPVIERLMLPLPCGHLIERGEGRLSSRLSCALCRQTWECTDKGWTVEMRTIAAEGTQ